MSLKRQYDQVFAGRDDFRIAILCALPSESDAVERIFDEIYETRSLLWEKSNGDKNSYTAGRIGRLHVVLAYMPGIGKVNAAIVGSSIRATFRNIALALVVGVCGGAPRTPNGQDIYLGDIVISTQLLQADYGREYTDEFVIKGPEEGNLGPAATEIRSFVRKLQGWPVVSKLKYRVREYSGMLLSVLDILPPARETDILFDSNYVHKHRESAPMSACTRCERSESSTCAEARRLTCSKLGCVTGNNHRARTRDVLEGPQILFGIVSSTDTTKKNGLSRDEFISEHNILAFEMEGAGIWNILATMVVKGVCDYADSHKNKDWQAYASITAAAATKAILDEWQDSSSATASEPQTDNATSSAQLRELYLQQLNFEQLDLRLHSISDALPNTGNWIFQTEEFLDWVNLSKAETHHRVLWIKGGPGVGKSTLMKHIFKSAEHLFPRHTTVAYFFRAAGTALENSRIGMLRSILFQLLRENSNLLDRFISANPQSRDAINTTHSWTYEELQSFLLLSAQQGWLRQTLILIDALDECTEWEARELVSFCADLAMNAVIHQTPIYICLSSRHYPQIRIIKGLDLNIDGRAEQENDIRHLITTKLNGHDANIFSRIFQSDQHNFLWVQLAINSLKRVSWGSDLLSLNTPLLEELYNELLEDRDDIFQEGKELLMQLVLDAFALLSPRALYLLIIAGTDAANLQSWDDCGMTDETAADFISETSRNLVVIVKSERGPVVQLVHESFRAYLLSHRVKPKGPKSESAAWASHKRIAECCLASLSMSGFPHNFDELERFPHIAYALLYFERHLSLMSTDEGSDTLYKQAHDIADRYSWYYHPEKTHDARTSA